MRARAEVIVLFVGIGLATAHAHGQNQGSMQGIPMSGARPEPDTTRMQQEETQAKAATGPLKITFGKKSADWTPERLAMLPHKTLTLYNEHVKASETYSGVPLIDLLTPLGVPDKPHGKDLRLYLVAEGSDGYLAVYSVAEVNPDVHDATVIVADAQDGKPLGGDGPLKLVATGEKRPARWVRNLAAIRVLTAQ